MKSIGDENTVVDKINKLKGINERLKEKRSSTNKYIEFFENNDDCPTCEQHIDEIFKTNMIVDKQGEYEKYSNGIDELVVELDKTQERHDAIQGIIKQIRENDAHVGSLTFSITEMEKFNATLQSEIDELQSGDVSKSDFKKLEKMKKS